MRTLFRTLNETLQSGRDAVLVTVIASSGSTPRGAGARMVVTEEGRICGTIGGGAVEYRSEKRAMQVLSSKSSHAEYYQLRKNEVQDLGMICGGDVHVNFQYIPAKDPEMSVVLNIIDEFFCAGEESWIISEITQGKNGATGVYGKRSGLLGIDAPPEIVSGLGRAAAQIEAGGRMFYCERLVQAGFVYIFGGGHVSQALVPALAAVGFRCVVLEDREEFCSAELFSGVEETLLINNSRILDFVTITEDDYVCVLTRGHKDDQTVQAQALKTPACYIGVIGSRRKSAGVFENLRRLGFTDEELGRITTPIGLDIHAETPAEIAVSITAQLISVRARRNMASTYRRGL